MKLTEEEFEKIRRHLPVPRRKPKISALDFINAVLYLVENGCKWRALQKEFGDWHVIYVRFSDWCKRGVWERIFAALCDEGVDSFAADAFCIDSTTVKVHPHGTGALKKRASTVSDAPREG
jgi:transposase